jgi:hypothetical protein
LACSRPHRVVHHRRAVGPLLLRDHRYAGALSPALKLLHRRGSEGVAGRQHHRATLARQQARQLADGGGLADPVDPDEEHHVGPLVGIDAKRLLQRPEQVHQQAGQRAMQRHGVVQLTALHPLGQLHHDLARGLHADVREQQSRLELLHHGVVDFLLAEQQIADPGRELAARLGEAGLQPAPETAPTPAVLFRFTHRTAPFS